MDRLNDLLKALKKDGRRITKARAGILSILIDAKEPLSPPAITSLLKKAGLLANKTTVYRELDFLKDRRVVRSLRLDNMSRYYELTPENHHHHLVCLDCEKIQHIELDGDLDSEEKKITKNTKFKILNHSLEFYGICRSCR